MIQARMTTPLNPRASLTSLSAQALAPHSPSIATANRGTVAPRMAV
jgi:hypothetical protein